MLDFKALGINEENVVPEEFKQYSKSVLAEYMLKCKSQSPEELLEVLKRASAICLLFRNGLLTGEIMVFHVTENESK